LPEYTTIYRGRDAVIDLDNDGYVLDIYPVDRGDSFIVTEADKIAFEVENAGEIADHMEDHAREMADFKRARGRERVGGE
jgi:hypothetical protein